MEHLIYFVIAFALATFGRYILYKKSKKPTKIAKKEKKNKKPKGDLAIELKYLSSKFKLDKEKIDTLETAKIVSILDGLIIASTCTLSTLISKDMILIFIIGIVLVFVLIFALFEVFGRILIKKGYGKNGL